jgi:hypothetical protein
MLPYWSPPLVFVDTISKDVRKVKHTFNNLCWVSFCHEVWSAEFTSRELWWVKSIFRQLWWDPYPLLIVMCQLMCVNRRHGKCQKQLAREALLWIICTRSPWYGLSAWGVILWLVYFHSLHIYKTIILINAKYMINIIFICVRTIFNWCFLMYSKLLCLNIYLL